MSRPDTSKPNPGDAARALGRLHVIVGSLPWRASLDVVSAALRAGADAGQPPVVQVRVGDDVLADRMVYEFALRVSELCRGAGATCLVNDRTDVALAVAAGGAHVGDDDLPVPAARRVLGPDPILGATARGPAAARERVAEGADYLGVGPAYRSGSKSGLPDPIGPEGVGAVAAAVEVPVIAIGGVTADRVPELLAAGAYGVAVIGAVNAAADPYAATLELLRALAEAAPGHAPGPGSGPAPARAAPDDNPNPARAAPGSAGEPATDAAEVAR